MEPWSVRLTAGISSSAARLTRSGIRHAPSRIEYSEWTWRWTKSAAAIGEWPVYAGVQTGLKTPLRAGRTAPVGREQALSRARERSGARPRRRPFPSERGSPQLARAESDQRQ